MELSTRRAWLPPAIGGFLVAVVAIGAWQVAADRGFHVPNPIQGQACTIGIYDTQLTVTIRPDLGYSVDCRKGIDAMNQGLEADNPYKGYAAPAPSNSTTLACRFRVKHGEVSIHDGGGGGLFAGLIAPMLCSKLQENPDLKLVTS